MKRQSGKTGRKKGFTGYVWFMLMVMVFMLWCLETLGYPDENTTSQSVITGSKVCGTLGDIWISIDYIPELGDTTGYITGMVNGVERKKCRVVVYNQVDDCCWWGPKPLWNKPYTKISNKCQYKTDTTTGGEDAYATAYRAYLVLKDAPVPKMQGESKIPDFAYLAMTEADRKEECDEPSIEFTYVPLYGDAAGVIKGVVKCADPDKYCLLIFIKVEDVLWTKPYYNQPLTYLNDDGTFSCDITTGGNDAYATEICAILVPCNITPIICGPCYELPEIPEAIASTCFDRSPTARTISFANYTWEVKRRDFPAGPGPNYFSDSEKDVWVDGNGLHLTIKNKDGVWYCTEVINQSALGYGAYRFQTNSRVDILDPNIVLGLFTWETVAYSEAYHELDAEFARWGNKANDTNAQFVVQPCSVCPGCGDNCTRFLVSLNDTDKYVTVYIVWQPGQAEFRAYYGNHLWDPPASDLIHKWIKTDGIPEPGNANARCNLWLFGGIAPTDGNAAEIVISDFAWQKDIPNWKEDCQEMAITIDGVSPYGDTNGYVWGHIACADYKKYAVAVYILVRGGWWTKPYWSTPLTNINSNGTWKCDITTGGVDEEARKVCAYLVPITYTPPSMSGEPNLPDELKQFQNACIDR